MFRFLYIKESQTDKYSINMLCSKTEQLIGYIIFVVPSNATYAKMISSNASQRLKKWWLEECKDKPYVDYSFIEKEFRNRGYGKLLYKAAATFIKARYGLRLYASGNQSKQAKYLWESLLREANLNFIITKEYLEAKLIGGNQNEPHDRN
jgi:GNAT superfamily N-acetyltransferase